MKIALLFCLATAATGAWLRMPPEDSSFSTVGFPAIGFSAKISGHVAQDGNYRLVAALRKVGHELGLSAESVPCALDATFTPPGHAPVTERITSISRYAEYGAAQIQYYEGAKWHLTRGDYTFDIASRGNCVAALSRAATLTLEPELIHPTERYLGRMFKSLLGTILLFSGLLGIPFTFVKPRKRAST